MDLKSVPVLPSLITLGNVFFGFLAMAKVCDAVWLGAEVTPAVIAMFDFAVILIFGAMVLDAVDGRVARMTGQTSAFGAQLDSLADMITFGVAPAFIAKTLINFHDGGANSLLPLRPKIYYVCAAIYVLCAAMRLARFNVETGQDESDHREFKGLPTPAAAAVVCSLIALFCSQGDSGAVISQTFMPEIHNWLVVIMPATLCCVGLLMVSKLPYPHLFYTLLRRRHSFPFLATLVVVIGVAAIEWQLALAAISLSYALSGFVLGAFRLVTRGDMGPPPPPPARVSGELEPPFEREPPRSQLISPPTRN